MSLPSDITILYSDRTDAYIRYVERVRHRQGIQAVLERSSALAPAQRILDAGCGTGLSIRATMCALARRGYDYREINGFDLTGAMIARCRTELAGVPHLELRRADVLRVAEGVPDSWRGYDLIVSASMLEYVSRTMLASALSALRERMAPGGRIIVFITRRLFVPAQIYWHCEGYTRAELRTAFAEAGFTHVSFPRYPPAYWWLNVGNHVVQAHKGQ